jgi:transcriptional regulator with XRE-family HTH domain
VLALAKQAGLSHTAVGNIERGTMPGIDTAEALANALGVSPGWLAYGLGPMELPKRRTTRPAASTAPASAT